MEAGRENKARVGAGAFETEWPSNDVSTSGGIFPHTTFYDADKKAMTSISATHHFARVCNCDGGVRKTFALVGGRNEPAGRLSKEDRL